MHSNIKKCFNPVFCTCDYFDYYDLLRLNELLYPIKKTTKANNRGNFDRISFNES